MNCKFWNDVQLTDHIVKLEHAHNLMAIYHRNGQTHKLYLLLSGMEKEALAAKTRINELEKEHAEWLKTRNGSAVTV